MNNDIQWFPKCQVATQAINSQHHAITTIHEPQTLSIIPAGTGSLPFILPWQERLPPLQTQNHGLILSCDTCFVWLYLPSSLSVAGLLGSDNFLLLTLQEEPAHDKVLTLDLILSSSLAS